MSVDDKIQVSSLFPTPLMIVRDAISETQCMFLIELFESQIVTKNASSPNTFHTKIIESMTSSEYSSILEIIMEHVENFGQLLFGEKLSWKIKESWLNKILTDGFQPMHNHANSFSSGIIYLTETDRSSPTLFHKHIGSSSYSFENDHDDIQLHTFNATCWKTPSMTPGDLVIFPSYLVHEVPRNSGGVRYSMAFNTIPDRLIAGAYSIRFESHDTE